ncbi:MAG: agmatine deiminase [Chloroflexi bacterium]|nr:agmatine deiminase [Chloroflexota bacterium]
MRVLASTPRADGFHMPGEFEPHDGCWMLFPFRGDVWRQKAVPAQQAFVEIVKAVARFEPVTVGATREQYEQAARLLPDNIRLVELSYDDIWMRDCGPTFVVNGRGDVRGVNWQFNAWGGLYAPYDQDNLVAPKVLALERAPRYDAPCIMEGGAIHVDGEGTLITTRECLLNAKRNADLSQAQVEALLMDYLNVGKIIWLDDGVYLDETGGHVDNLCCFVRPGVVALTWTDDENDPQHAISQRAYAILQNERDARGRKLEIHKIHQPGPLYFGAEELEETEDSGQINIDFAAGDRLPVSYINFYIANGGVIVPTYDDAHDAAALAQIAALFPERQVVGVYAREIALGGGSIHCITQQQPRAGA